VIIVDIILPRNLKEFKAHLRDPLYRNSFYILLTLFFGAVLGFVFWIIAAKIYSQSEVGINTALISAVSLIAVISFLGLDQSIIRFFPERNQFKVLVTSSIVIMFSTILFGIIFVLGINIWSPELALIKNNLLAFFVSLVAFSLTTPTANAFIALRKGKYYFYQNLFMNLRVVLVFIPFLGSLGIFLSFGISSLIALIFSFIFIYRLKIKRTSDEKILKIDWGFLRDSFHFSAGNYFYVLFATIPIYLLPIIVLNVLGSAQTAYYYIAYTIASFLFMISAAFSTSLFVEGSHGESLRKNTIKSLVAIFLILIPLAIILYFFGGYLLGLFGKNYTIGFDLLRVMVISSFFYAICQVYFSIGKVQKNIRDLIIISLLIFILLVGLSYFLMLQFGILGVGYAWIISYFVGSIFVMVKIRKL
jgi:O-antigen/teichoic acid export membrane protein